MTNHESGEPPDQEMPEYQMFPEGMWHMLAAIMLMIFSTAGIVILASRMVAPFMDVGTLSTTSFVAIVVMSFILSTPTFLLSRGWSKCHTFLLWLNALYLFLLAVGVGFFFLQADYGHVLIGVIGVVFAGTARFLYNTDAYRAGVEYYRLIWAHYRAGTSRKS